MGLIFSMITSIQICRGLECYIEKVSFVKLVWAGDPFPGPFGHYETHNPVGIVVNWHWTLLQAVSE